MKTSFLVIFIVCFSICAFCQDCANNFLGTKSLYKPPQESYSSPPAGYQPVFISYAGRHGARHLTKDVNTSVAFNLLLKADSVGGLTTKGSQLKTMVLLLEKVEKKEYKSISEEGKTELMGIAERMYQNNSSIFKTATVNVTITKELRTRQSADAFIKALEKSGIPGDLPKLINDTTLRFYDLSPAYTTYEKSGKWQRQIATLKNIENYSRLVKTFTATFFSNGFLNALTANQAEAFATDIHGFRAIVYSIKGEIAAANMTTDDLNFEQFFTCEALKIFNKIDEAEDFYLKGPGDESNGIQVKIAAPLLLDFMNTTAAFIKTKKVNVQLRFTHAEAISPMAALLGITTGDKSTKDVNKISEIWNAGEVIPLSANIQWIIYGNGKKNKYLLKLLLNEKEVAIDGLPTTMFPFYTWKDVQKLFSQKLHGMNVKSRDNMYYFLQHLE